MVEIDKFIYWIGFLLFYGLPSIGLGQEETLLSQKMH